MTALRQQDYTALKAQCSQQTVSLLYKSYKSFFKASSDYSRNPKKYHGRPKMPSYRDKDDLFTLVFTNQSATIDNDGHPRLSRDLTLRTVRTSIVKRNFRQIRIVPLLDMFKVEIVYNKTEGEYTRKAKERNRKLHSSAIDVGVDNLATVTSDNAESVPLIVNGRPLKSVNQNYNKRLASLKSMYSKQGIRTGRTARRLTMRRNQMVKGLHA